MNDIEEIYLPPRNQHQTVSKVSNHNWVPVTHNGLSTRFKFLVGVCAVIGIVVFLVALIVPTLTNNKSTSLTNTTYTIMNTTTQTTSISITSTLTTTTSISTTLASTASTSTSGSTSASTSTIITTFTSLITLTSTTAASTSITTSAWTSTTLTSVSTASTSSITTFITSTLSAAISTISTTTTTISTVSTTTFTTSTPTTSILSSTSTISTLSTTPSTTSTPTSLTSSTTTTTTTSTSTTATSTTSTSMSTTTTSTSTSSTISSSTTTTTISTSTATSTTSTSTTTTTVSCAPGFSATQSAKCVDILSNLYNCGSIGYVCSSNYTICSAGICKTAPTIQLSGAIPIPAWVGVTTDDDIQQVSLPVNVTLYNYSTDSVTVSSNGLLCLGSCTDAYANQKLPTTSVGGPTAFVFWYDLAIYSGTAQMVYYATIGTAPNRITGFEFYTTSSTYPSNYYHFQILFYENLPNIVEYVYFEISDGGSLATIGVQQPSSGPSITYSVNQAFAVAYNTTLLFDTNEGTYTRI
ncbi:unnamed protein product [Adineta steineri]|uniref:Uncharacterized protein n=1 Tax=Adineta steineri TaxID=433720 RepID=A0A813RHL4_9BILA|nr:unnamed protein product [Adineta steineri]